MNRRLGLAAAVAAVVALILAPSLTAAGAAAKTVVRIDLKGAPNGSNPSGGSGTFVLTSGTTTDRGTQTYTFSTSGSTKGYLTLTGKRGGLVLSTRSRPSGLSVDSEGLDLWTGTWKIVSGTGAYAGAHAVGAYVGIIGPSYKVAFHLEGFRT